VIFYVAEGLITLSIGFVLGMFAASLIKSAKENAYDGTVLVNKNPDDSIIYTLEINGDLDQLQYKKKILLEVAPASPDRE
jgi:hypothetical protein